MLDAHAESTAVKLSASVLNAFSACAMSLSELHPSPGYTTHFGPPSVEQETMNVEDLMTLAPHVCRPKDSLHAAAQLMWRHDCGTLPVVDDDSNLVGMITDRDICMGGYIQHQSLTRLRVDQSMARNVVTCRADDDIAAAAQVMAEHQVRRLPVVDGDDRVVGVVSLCDVVRAGRAGLEPTAVVDTLAAIVTPRPETRSTKSTQPTVQLQPKPSRARAAKKSTKKKSTKGTTKKAARTSRKR